MCLIFRETEGQRQGMGIDKVDLDWGQSLLSMLHTGLGISLWQITPGTHCEKDLELRFLQNLFIFGHLTVTDHDSL